MGTTRGEEVYPAASTSHPKANPLAKPLATRKCSLPSWSLTCPLTRSRTHSLTHHTVHTPPRSILIALSFTPPLPLTNIRQVFSPTFASLCSNDCDGSSLASVRRVRPSQGDQQRGVGDWPRGPHLLKRPPARHTLAIFVDLGFDLFVDSLLLRAIFVDRGLLL